MRMGIFHRYHMRQVLGSVLLTVSLSLPWASPAGATIFYDEEMETAIPQISYLQSIGVAAIDTSVKMSGNGSLRLIYPSDCVSHTSTCGGFTDFNHPASSNVWIRQYVRFSPGFVTGEISTKWLREDTTGIESTYVMMLWWSSPQFGATIQQVPPGSSFNAYYGYQMPQGQWVCVEIHKQLNTPGASNGVLEAWADGVQIYGNYSIPFRASGDNSLLTNTRLFRQNGSGSLWIDRFAVGDQRIGCSGSVPKGDTTPPASPTGLTAR